MKSPHEILGVSRNASAAEIKLAFREKAKATHPDHHPDDPTAEERFKEISAAYEKLEALAAGYSSILGFSGTVVRDEFVSQPSGRTCSRCKGTGFDPLDGIRREAGLGWKKHCSRCHGTGRSGGARATPPPRRKRESAESRWRREQGR